MPTLSSGDWTCVSIQVIIGAHEVSVAPDVIDGVSHQPTLKWLIYCASHDLPCLFLTPTSGVLRYVYIPLFPYLRSTCAHSRLFFLSNRLLVRLNKSADKSSTGALVEVQAPTSCV